MARYTASRQKACAPCSAAKTKCDRKPGKCTRCTLRGFSCVYPRAVQSAGSVNNVADDAEADYTDPGLTSQERSASNRPRMARSSCTDIDLGDLASESAQSTALNSTVDTVLSSTEHPMLNDPRHTSLLPKTLETPDFSNAELSLSSDLCCPIDADAISNRWLHSYIPLPGQKHKQYSASITAFIFRILKSYVAVTVHGHGHPPFVHTSQVMAIATQPPLSTCLTLVRMCDKPLPGSEEVVVNILQKEMEKLYEQHIGYDDISLLAAFQAYLIYCMVLFFRLKEYSSSFLRQAMTDLQGLACSSSRRGLVCIAESRGTRPRWEAWIVAEAKRRTLFTMYMFDSLLSALEGIPTLLGTELEGLPGPANRPLWTACTRQEWESAYDIFLADWNESFRIDELWPVPDHLDELGKLERCNRVDQWLEKVDEFGTMLYAVTSCTHGG